ncbi:MAG: YitT family protein, partial [Clostridia bacterium]|nr:YitT family protein [Clostridia bacterium]
MRTQGHTPLTAPQRYLLMTVGIIIMAVGVYFFKFPNNFSTGGVSGLSIILGRLFPDTIFSPSMFVLIINTLLLIVGYLFIGHDFAFSTVYCSMLLSLLLAGMERLWPISEPLTDQPMLELCFAVLLPAIGSAILFNLDASSGGTDVIAMIVMKYSSLNIGSALMV